MFLLHCLLAALLGARSIACPRGFVLSQGVQPHSFRCYRWDPALRESDHDGEPLEVLRGFTACRALLQDDHTVACAP